MSVRRDVIQRLKEAGLRPRKGLGQTFLVDETALRRIVEAADLTHDDTVVEIGAGPGTLTEFLAAQARQVLAVEIDPNMIEVLRSAVVDCNNVQIVQGDFLTLSIEELLDIIQLEPDRQYKVVGNLPYYITSAILRCLLEADRKPSCLVITVQEEVARRIVARPGEMSILAVSVQFYGHPHIVAHIPAGAFYPVPKIDSAVVRIDLTREPTVDVENIHWFFSVVRAGFSAKRKQLHNTLTHTLNLSGAQVHAALARARIDPTRRAQTLTLNEWACLSHELQVEMTPCHSGEASPHG